MGRRLAVLLRQYLVQRPRQVEVEQTRKTGERKARGLERERLQVGQPHADDLADRVARLEPKGLRDNVARRYLGRRQDTRAGGDVLPSQLLGETGERGDVALDLG